jgi:hypothetical protein
MNENSEKESRGFLEDIAGALDHKKHNERIRRLRTSSESKSKRKILIFGCIGVALLIILIAVFSRDDDEIPKEDFPTIQARLSQLERRITHIEGMEERLVFLEKQEKEFQKYFIGYGRSKGSLAQQVDVLSEKVDQLEKAIAIGTAKTEALLPHQKKFFPLAKGRYHEVSSGDTLYLIALKYGTSVDELCRLNNITPIQIIYPGQKLLVAPEDAQ